MPDQTGNAQYDAITTAIKAFKFWDYGLDEADPNSEYAEWVPDLAGAIHEAVGGAAEPSAIEQRLRAFVAELEMAERANQAPLPYDLLIATLQHRVLDPRALDSSGPERMGADPVRCAICTHPAGDHSVPRGREPFCHACEPPAWNHAMTTDPKEASA